MARSVILFVSLLIPSIAMADGGLCKCSLLERLPEWIALHDEWWSCNVALHEQQREYTRITGAIREREGLLPRIVKRKTLRAYVPFVINPGIEAYNFPQHPTEDRANNIPESAIEVEACEVQLGRDFLPEVKRAAAHLQYLRRLK